MKNPEYEKDFRETDDGYSEKQLDINTENGALKGKKTNKVYSLFEKKRRK